MQDPYANAYYKQWCRSTDIDKLGRMLGRGGWVGTRNYELDSGAYFISLVIRLLSSGQTCFTSQTRVSSNA